jgi:hypothetical protein
VAKVEFEVQSVRPLRYDLWRRDEGGQWLLVSPRTEQILAKETHDAGDACRIIAETRRKVGHENVSIKFRGGGWFPPDFVEAFERLIGSIT